MIESPVLVIGCPRSGTTLLYNILSEVPSLWSLGYESKAIIEHFHHPRVKDWESGALDESDLTPQSRRYMMWEFEQGAAPGSFWASVNRLRGGLRRNRIWQRIKKRGRTEKVGASVSSALPQQGLDMLRTLVRVRNTVLWLGSGRPVRLLEKTPENCLRLPFLLSLFPDARVIYLTRDGRTNINSLIEGWRQPHLFRGYQVPAPLNIPDYSRDRWAFTLIPGWRELVNHPLEEVCAWQWIRCNEAVLDHRNETAGRVPYLTLQYEALVSDPAGVLGSIAEFIEVDPWYLERHGAELPRINAVSSPDQDKWRRQNPEAIARVAPLIGPMMAQLGYDSNLS